MYVPGVAERPILDRDKRPSLNRPQDFRIGVVGGSGYIGSHVRAAGAEVGLEIAPVPGFRVGGVDSDDALASAEKWQARHANVFDELCAHLDGLDALIYAGGLARPGASDRRELFAANATHPAVVALAAAAAGVRRLVHVSSAVVQGRLDPLDESHWQLLLSPYAESKAVAERFLLNHRNNTPPEVVIYRPTSVQSASRHTTRQLSRLVALPFFPVVGDGSKPVPVALIENVAAGILFAATTAKPPDIALQPCEGVTTRMLIEFFAPRRIISLSLSSAQMTRRIVIGASAPSARLTALARRLEIVLNGQGVEARNLAAAGFVPPVGHEGWIELGRQMRQQGRGR